MLALLVSLAREGGVNPWLFSNHPMDPGAPPDGYRWSLWLLYAITILAVWILYYPCRWFARLKATKKARWLSYL